GAGRVGVAEVDIVEGDRSANRRAVFGNRFRLRRAGDHDGIFIAGEDDRDSLARGSAVAVIDRDRIGLRAGLALAEELQVGVGYGEAPAHRAGAVARRIVADAG